MTRSDELIGGALWRRLIAAGGFVWTRSDGRKEVHFNKGFRPTKELMIDLRRDKAFLSAYVDEMHRRDLEYERRSKSLAVGRFRLPIKGADPAPG